MRIGLGKAREHGHEVGGAALASDAFFPFADGPQLALEAGVGSIVPPGGSKRGAEGVAAVEAADATMGFTGRRPFPPLCFGPPPPPPTPRPGGPPIPLGQPYP